MQSEHYTKKAQQIVSGARVHAEQLGHSFIGSEHLILSMLADGSNVAAAILRTHRVPLQRFQQAVLREIGSGTPCTLAETEKTPAFRRILQRAEGAGPDRPRAGIAVESGSAQDLAVPLVDVAGDEALEVGVVQKRRIELYQPARGGLMPLPP